jgi:hypothetical protein
MGIPFVSWCRSCRLGWNIGGSLRAIVRLSSLDAASCDGRSGGGTAKVGLNRALAGKTPGCGMNPHAR